MSGYTVKFSVDTINEMCDNPGKYGRGELVEAMNSAYIHYTEGNKSRQWYEYVVSKLTV